MSKMNMDNSYKVLSTNPSLSRSESGGGGFDSHFKHPFNMIVEGPTGVGKSTFVTEMLLKRTVDTVFDYFNIL